MCSTKSVDDMQQHKPLFMKDLEDLQYRSNKLRSAPQSSNRGSKTKKVVGEGENVIEDLKGLFGNH